MVIQQSRPPAKTWLLAGLELIAALLAAGLIASTQRPCTCPHHHVKPAAPQIHWGWVECVSLLVAVAALGWWLVRREANAAIVSAAALAGLASSPAVRGLAAQSHLIAMVALELLMVACPLLLLRTRPRPSVARPARSSGWFAVAAAVLYGGLLIVIHLPAVHRHGAAAPLWLAPAALAIGVAYWFGVLCTADRMTTRARRVLLLGAQEVAAFIGLLSLFGATWDQRLGGLFMMATCTAVTLPLVRRLQPCDSGPMTKSVAVIGAGPGGLVAARWLLSQGFEPTIFEQAPTLGGQWTGILGRSGVWPAMHTNTSRIMTAFSDLEHDNDLVYPSNRDILGYLHRYSAAFGLTSRIRCDTRVELLRRGETGWLVSHDGTDESFERIVLASGRFHAPAIPRVPGLDAFAGSAGAIPTYHYRGPSPYLGKRVLVAGCAISALEIAAELAQLGAARVVVTQRRQRYVLPKYAAGVPSDHRMFTRYGTLASETLPRAEIDRQLREIVVEAGGSPEQYGAPAPDPSLFVAGVTLHQGYLPLVAEGRITVRPWMESVAGETVTFGDGHAEEFDAIVLGTGFNLSLPFLSEEIRAILDLDAVHLDADRYTFHPDLPGLAFIGMFEQSGGYFVPLELQARWIAYTWGGTIAAQSETDQRSSINAYRARRGTPQKTQMNLVALAFARAAGVEPALQKWPQLRRALLFGPLAPSCFRLEGPDALPDAPGRFARDAAAFDAISSNEFTEREGNYWSLVEAAARQSNSHDGL